ncbi:MAG: hypothetical protein G01um101449_100 [Parcubacteria group bacterium Gr01-1014_49]|nr:MAG: hypothetical protein G01um101449_100 [Parcubacteria group bacterium Gr01-1014_49]
MWYLIIAVVIIALGLWYYYGKQTSSTGTESPAAQQAASDVSGNTTIDISADLDQIPDVSADLDQDAAAADQAVQGL